MYIYIYVLEERMRIGSRNVEVKGGGEEKEVTGSHVTFGAARCHVTLDLIFLFAFASVPPSASSSSARPSVCSLVFHLLLPFSFIFLTLVSSSLSMFLFLNYLFSEATKGGKKANKSRTTSLEVKNDLIKTMFCLVKLEN